MAVLNEPATAPSAAAADTTISDKCSAGISSQGISNSLSQVDGATDYQLNASRRRNYTPQPTIPPTHPQHQAQAIPQPQTHHHQHQVHHMPSSSQLPPHHHQRPRPSPNTNIVTSLLPYCTTEPPLRQDQVIALTDVVGNLKELVLLALGAAAADTGCVERLGAAVGSRAAAGIAEFFVDEWEIEG